MQCMWLTLEEGDSYLRQGQKGKALKRYHTVDKFFSDIFDDQFDFHTYCLRKTTLRSYVEYVYPLTGMARSLSDLLMSNLIALFVLRITLRATTTLSEPLLEQLRYGKVSHRCAFDRYGSYKLNCNWLFYRHILLLLISQMEPMVWTKQICLKPRRRRLAIRLARQSSRLKRRTNHQRKVRIPNRTIINLFSIANTTNLYRTSQGGGSQEGGCKEANR